MTSATQANAAAATTTAQFLLRFDNIRNPGRAMAFPCAPDGTVNLNDLSGTARNNFHYAKAMVGREFARPKVVFDAAH